MCGTMELPFKYLGIQIGETREGYPFGKRLTKGKDNHLCFTGKVCLLKSAIPCALWGSLNRRRVVVRNEDG